MSTTSVDDTDLYTDTITILTRAATMSGSDGAPDFADFLAHVLAATAANVGGPDQLVAGRPGLLGVVLRRRTGPRNHGRPARRLVVVPHPARRDPPQRCRAHRRRAAPSRSDGPR